MSKSRVKIIPCKRSIQCLVSPKILTPQPLTARRRRRVCTPPAFGAGGGHTRWVERGWGVNILEDARHSVLYICKYFHYTQAKENITFIFILIISQALSCPVSPSPLTILTFSCLVIFSGLYFLDTVLKSHHETRRMHEKPTFISRKEIYSNYKIITLNWIKLNIFLSSRLVTSSF